MKKFTLPTLSYGMNSLEPIISAITLDLHYNKHHNTYCTTLNKLLEESNTFVDNTDDQALINIMIDSFGNHQKNGLFNNAGQVFNHNFYWASITNNAKIMGNSTLLKQIQKDYGKFESFRDLVIQGGISQFGSGWVWLVWNKKDNRLEIMKTANAESPAIYKHLVPLFVLDVWEHAYYVDYHNRRLEYLTKCFDELLNWDFIEDNFEKAIS